MKKIFVLLAVLILTFIIYSYKKNPYTILEDHNIYLDNHNKIVEFENEWGGVFNIHGNGSTVIRILINNEPFTNVLKQIDKKTYKKFPVSPSDASKIPVRFLESLGEDGYYRIEVNSESETSLIILDSTNKQIIFFYELL